ncbi:hypothetical protein [Nonomuraea sp. NPDC049784]|uniref:hypothetical protein n=1 Tax=Nonomuraea sp. NPDC049784 TaxID=3154361 RepID=UPI0033F9E491
MKVTKRTILMLSMATAGLTCIPAPAGAAAGSLTLYAASGKRVYSAVDPAAGCYSTVAPFTSVTNGTREPVIVYQEIGCTGASRVVNPATTPVPVGERRSVRVPL